MRLVLLQLAYSNLWISATAAGFTWANQRLLGLQWDGLSGYLAFATMFMVYTFAKAIHFDPQADCVNDPERTSFLLRWRKPLIASAASCYALALGLAQARGLAWLCLLPFLTAVLYDLKWLPAGWRYRRLKDIPGVKSLVVALTWALVTVLLPALLGPPLDPLLVALVFLWNTLVWFVNTAFFDLGDMRGDALEGTRTLPLVLGFQRTRRLLLGLTFVAAALLEWGLWQGLLEPGSRWINLVTLYSAAYVGWARDPDQDLGFTCDVVADGIGLVAWLMALWSRA